MARVVVAAVAAVLALAAQATGSQAPEWHRSLVGIPLPGAQSTRFHHFVNSTLPREQSILLAFTERDVLASLDPITGALHWRHRLTGSAAAATLHTCDDEHAIVMSEDGSVESVSLGTGAVRWKTASEVAGPEDAPGSSSAVCWPTPTGNDFIVLSNGIVRRLSGDTGQLLWRVNMGLVGLASRAGLARIGDGVGLLAPPSRGSKERTVHLYHLDAAIGSASPPTLTLDVSKIASDFLVLPSDDEPSLVWIDGGRLWGSGLVRGSLSAVQAIETKGGPFTSLVDVGVIQRGIVVARRNDGSAVVVRWSQARFTQIGEFADPAVDVHFSGYSDRVGDPHVARLSYAPSLQLSNLQVISTSSSTSDSSTTVTGYTFPFDLETFGDMSSLAIQVSRREDASVVTRALVSTSTGSLQLWYGSTLLWTREEGISSIDINPAFLLAASSPIVPADLQSSNIVQGVYDRLRKQLGLDSTDQRSPSVAASGHFVLGSSRAGILFSITDGGATRWRTGVLASRGTFLEWTSVVSVPGSSEGDESIIVGSARVFDSLTRAGRGTSLFSVDAATGRLLRREDHAADLPSLCVPTLLDARCASQITQSRRAVSGRSHSGLNWTFELEADHEVVSITPQTLGQVASLGRVLGSRSTLLKYLNPDLVAIVSFSAPSSSASIALVDSVTGAVSFTVDQIHQVDERSNIQVLLRDNWLLYSYRLAGDVARTTQIVSIELYRSQAVYTPRSSVPTIDRIEALSRTYVSSLGLSLLGTTTTALGITSYSALFVSDAGQLVAVPRRILDPRRTYEKPTKDDQEEMLLPYDVVLPLDSRWIVSSNYQTLGLDNVVSVPGQRESESLVLAYGMDLFSTRLSPSRSFDVLSPTFNKLQLLVTVTGLSGALVVTRSMVKVGRLRQKWYTM